MPLLQTMLLRSLQQAVYSPDNKGHFGLGYEAYTHFTSPIRRYPDLLVHRSIKAILAGKKYKPAQKWDALGVQCSVTERRADEASRDVLNFLKCYFMQDKVGEVFEGSVAAVTGFGLFVLLDNLYVEGLVHISELGSDYFQYDDRRHELRGERTGQVYRLTDRIRVRVARVDLDTSKIDFVLAPLGAPASTEPYSPPARNGDRRGNTRSRFASNAPVVEAPLAAQTPLASPAEAAVNQAVASVALAEPGKKSVAAVIATAIATPRAMPTWRLPRMRRYLRPQPQRRHPLIAAAAIRSSPNPSPPLWQHPRPSRKLRAQNGGPVLRHVRHK